MNAASTEPDPNDPVNDPRYRSKAREALRAHPEGLTRGVHWANGGQGQPRPGRMGSTPLSPDTRFNRGGRGR
jgi:hypothetical protein